MSIINIGRALGLAATKVRKGSKAFWKDTKIEAKSVWGGTKKVPKRLVKAGWEHPLTAGIVIGVGGGLLLGEKRVRYGYENNKSKRKKKS